MFVCLRWTSGGDAEVFGLWGGGQEGLRGEQGVEAVAGVGFGSGEMGLGFGRIVGSEPEVVMEAEGIWFGIRADIECAPDLAPLELDDVVVDFDVPAGREAVAFGFLEDAEDPFVGVDDRIVVKAAAIEPGEGGCAHSSDDEVVVDFDVAGFVFGAGRAEVIEAG